MASTFSRFHLERRGALFWLTLVTANAVALASAMSTRYALGPLIRSSLYFVEHSLRCHVLLDFLQFLPDSGSYADLLRHLMQQRSNLREFMFG